jgi:hypothetical protein
MEKYKIGGLEPTDKEEKLMDIEGITYVLSDKFRTMLRDSFIDWGTFLEVYHDNLNYTLLFDQMVRLLNIKENENLREFMIPLIKKIYHLPAESHMISMLKQFMLYEPVSIAIHAVFTTIKMHYEHIVELFIVNRNKYITEHELQDKPNDYEELTKYWNQMNNQYDLDSSSVILLFLNPPDGLKSKLNINISGMEREIATLKDKIKKFHYLGFCPKVPHERLQALLGFPLNEFVKVINKLNPNIKFPNYKELEKKIAEKMYEMPKKPYIKDTFTRQNPPDYLVDKLELAKWYINNIMELRKNLVDQGYLYEQYYIQQAKIFNEINEILSNELRQIHT